MKNKRFTWIMIVAAVLLAVPAIAMSFTDEVNWSVFDFLMAAGLLFGTGIALELTLRTVKSNSGRWVAGGLVLFALALVWAELAVGIFGSPVAGS